MQTKEMILQNILVTVSSEAGSRADRANFERTSCCGCYADWSWKSLCYQLPALMLEA